MRTLPIVAVLMGCLACEAERGALDVGDVADLAGIDGSDLRVDDAIGDATGEADGAPSPEFTFTVSVTEWVGTKGNPDSAYAGAGRAWSGEEMPSVVAAAAGDCVFVRPTELPLCDPPCGPGTICVANDTCGPPWKALGAGDIVITGLKSACTLVPETQYHYYQPRFEPEPAGGDVFDEGDLLTATAPGDDVPPFTVTTRGVARVETTLACPPASEPGQGLDVAWTPGAQPGDRVSFAIMSGNHGTQFSRVLCQTADSGSLHVDAKLFESYLADWHPMNSWHLTRWHEEGVDVPGVRVTFAASSHAGCMW
jgi:hypothetical protein